MSAHERERLSAYLDDALPPPDRAAVEAHLAACDECQALLSAMAEVDAAARLPVAAPEGYFDDFAARVRRRIEAPGAIRASGPRPARVLPPWAWAAAAVLVLAVVTPLTLLERRGERPAERVAARPEQPAARAPGAPKAEPTVPPTPRPPAAQPRQAPSRPEPPEAQAAGALRLQKAAAPAPAAPAASASEAAVPAERKAAGAGAASTEARRDKEELADAAAPRVVEMRTAAAANAGRGELAAAGVAAEGGAVASRAVDVVAPAGVDGEFQRLAAARPAGLAEWRALRERWRALAARVEGPQADEARVRAVAAGLEALRAGGEETDRLAFRREAQAYLARPDALQRERVRALVAAEPPSR